MNLILKELEKSSKYNDFIKNIENKTSPIAISGLTGVAETGLLASVLENTKRPILLITYNDIQAQSLVKDLKFFTENVTNPKSIFELYILSISIYFFIIFLNGVLSIPFCLV